MSAKRGGRRPGNGHVPRADEPRLPVPIKRPQERAEARPGPRLRQATVQRRTRSTEITLALDLDGAGRTHVVTPLPFFSRMLENFARHSLIDLRISAAGASEPDAQRLVEDVGVCLGEALVLALPDRAAVHGLGDAALPIGEGLLRCHLDLSDRHGFVFKIEPPSASVSGFDHELAEAFFAAIAAEARLTVHLIQEYGRGRRQIVEGCFSAFGRALERAATIDRRRAVAAGISPEALA